MPIPQIPNALAPHMTPAGNQVMTPGGGGTGAPLQGDPNAQGTIGAMTPQQLMGAIHSGGFGGMNRFGAAFGGIGGMTNALMDWRGQRPVFDAASMTRPEYHQQIVDWRQQRPSFFGGFGGFGGNQSGPIMTPGGGGTGAPIQADPATPVTPAQNITVQGAVPSSNPFQLPTY